GSLAGGATTEPPGDWGDFPRDDLEGPYSPPANPDPLAGVEMFKVGRADGWTGEVGKIVPVSLAVKVVDVDGWPVEGAEVTFLSLRGGGSLVDGDDYEHPTLTVTTNSLGIARARFRLGKHTSVEPFYRRRPGDEHATQVLMHLVEAVAASAQGPLVIDEPFQLFASPGAPVVLLRTDTNETELDHCRAGTWVDTITVAAEDQYGNPVSNVHVHFSVGEPTRYAGCTVSLCRSSSECLPRMRRRMHLHLLEEVTSANNHRSSAASLCEVAALDPRERG
ncbi:MAG: hypothetical protein GY838_14865, partial [bacterium]|nr:hypothetical protein [bacterium]